MAVEPDGAATVGVGHYGRAFLERSGRAGKIARMDNSVLAGWIGFGGAFVGGGMAWLGGWLTMRWQWEKDLGERRMERLDAAMATLQSAASPLWVDVMANTWSVDDIRSVTNAGLSAATRARSLSPHLANVLAVLVTATHERALPALTGGDTERRLLGAALSALNACVVSWMDGSVRFESERLSAEQFLERAEQTMSSP